MSFGATGNSDAGASLHDMARYFFHSANGSRQRDVEGLELESIQAAELEAVRLLGDLLSERPEALFPSLTLTITVTDASGQVVFSARASAMRDAKG